MANEQDLLLEYTTALDSGNLDWMIEVLRLASQDAGLWAAIMDLHKRCDGSSSYTAQVLQTRKEGNEKASKASPGLE